MITLRSGLFHSMQVLDHLRRDKELNDYKIDVGTFTNLRECGLTFIICEAKVNGKWQQVPEFTWCIYEHRHTGEIIINGRAGRIVAVDMLAYKGTTNEYFAAIKPTQHRTAAKRLIALIKEWVDLTK